VVPYGRAFAKAKEEGEMASEVNIPGVGNVPGDHPIVIIGPNGVGKTRLGVAIRNSNKAERVSALRNVEIPDIPLQRLAQASREVQNMLQQVITGDSQMNCRIFSPKS
jgi:hypothetical protein